MTLNSAQKTSSGVDQEARTSPVFAATTENLPHRVTGRLSIIVPFFIGLFGVLLASFPARNLDVWKHLADGRDLLLGSTISSTWLYDLGTYVVFRVFGGAGLAGAKALMCGAVAILLFALSRSN